MPSSLATRPGTSQPVKHPHQISQLPQSESKSLKKTTPAPCGARPVNPSPDTRPRAASPRNPDFLLTKTMLLETQEMICKVRQKYFHSSPILLID